MKAFDAKITPARNGSRPSWETLTPSVNKKGRRNSVSSSHKTYTQFQGQEKVVHRVDNTNDKGWVHGKAIRFQVRGDICYACGNGEHDVGSHHRSGENKWYAAYVNRLVDWVLMIRCIEREAAFQKRPSHGVEVGVWV